MSNPTVACWPGALAPREKLLMQGPRRCPTQSCWPFSCAPGCPACT
ncbi:hypothetical protein IC615_04000 [Serratia ureilytica]